MNQWIKNRCFRKLTGATECRVDQRSPGYEERRKAACPTVTIVQREDTQILFSVRPGRGWSLQDLLGVGLGVGVQNGLLLALSLVPKPLQTCGLLFCFLCFALVWIFFFPSSVSVSSLWGDFSFFWKRKAPSATAGVAITTWLQLFRQIRFLKSFKEN